MGKTGHFVHVADKTHDVTFGTSYAADKVVSINCIADQYAGSQLPKGRANNFAGNIQLIRIDGTRSSGASTITLKGYTDVEGNKLVIPPSSSTLESSIDGTKFSAVFQVNAFHAHEDADLFFFLKTNTGTFTVTELVVTWFE
jgi:hypothetical protein